MTDRTIYKIGDLCDQIRGVTYSKSEATLAPTEGFKPVLRANNITETGLTFDDLIYVPARNVATKQKLKANDILIATSSGSIEVVGKAARVISDFDGGFGAFCKVLRPNTKVDPSYFSHYFKTKDYRRRISSLAAGANINNLRNEHLDDLDIPLPPLPEQRRIAAILDKADVLRAKRREAIAKLDQLLQSVFLEMFGDPVTNPKGWPEKLLAEVVNEGTIVTYGIVQAGEEFTDGIPYIRTGDISAGEIVEAGLRRTDPAIAKKFSRSRVEAGDVVMSIRATVGTTALVPTSLDGANLTQGTARIAVGEKMARYFALHHLRSAGTQRWIERQVKGATFREITLGRLRALPMMVPPKNLQDKFDLICQHISRSALASQSNSAGLEKLFQSLQQLAFAGRL